MSDLPRHLRDLEDALMDLPDGAQAMMLSEVDGYVTGIALLPNELPSEEWLSTIWQPNPETPDYLYHDRELIELIARLATQHFRMVARDLHRGTFEPIYEVDDQDELLWEYWMHGFGRAMSLHPEAFGSVDATDDEAITALSGLVSLSMLAVGDLDREEVTPQDDDTVVAADNDDLAEGEEEPLLGEEERAALAKHAPDLIPEYVATLYDWTRAIRPAPVFAVPVRKEQIGRNDPCPCGSGKKHKRCCGMAD